MPSKRATFELQVLRDKNWTVQNLYDDEDTAKRQAEHALRNRVNGGVKVIRIWKRADGEHTEKVILEKLSEAEPVRDVRIVPIDAANVCRDEADFLSPESRATMGRLFRKYLDAMVLTPTEVIHVYREYQRIWETEGIVMSGVDRIALIQSRDSDVDAKARGEEIYRAVEMIGARARRCARMKSLPRDLSGGMAAVFAAVAPLAYDDADRRFFAASVLARELVQRRDWLAKLDLLGELIAGETDVEAMGLLDEVTAEVFGSAGVIQDALGPKSNLAAALFALIDILEGARVAFAADLPRREAFAAALASGCLPRLHAALKDRFLRMLAGGGDLSRNEASEEGERFRELLNRLLDADGLIGEAETAHALLERACRMVVEGGATGRIRAMQRMMGCLDTPARRVRLLCCLAPLFRRDPEPRDFLLGLLRSLIGDAASVDAIVGRFASPVAAMGVISGLARALAATALPVTVIAPLLGRLDALLADFLVEQQVIERIDRADQPLSVRATTLVNFLLSGLLTEGRASTLARERIRAHLKRSDFVEAFAADFPDATARERGLREFYALLAKAGFSLKG